VDIFELKGVSGQYRQLKNGNFSWDEMGFGIVGAFLVFFISTSLFLKYFYPR
jgi:hypothetical protein